MAREADDNPCNTPGEPHPFELTIQRQFAAPPEKVWKAWMDPELLKQWFCPRP